MTQGVETNNVDSVGKATVTTVTISRDEIVTMTEVQGDIHQRTIVRDGRQVEWIKVYEGIRGHRVTPSQLHLSIQKFYGKDDAISRMRCYKFLNGLVNKELATVEWDYETSGNVYIVK